nr:transposase [Clostridium sp.]
MSCYPRAIDTWNRNWRFVKQLFNYPSYGRKVMFTTNAIESVNSSHRKVFKK